MWSFVNVKANLLYILEEELRPEFQINLSKFKNAQEPVFIVVQLKKANSDFEPLIKDLKAIRIDKAVKKVNNWITICFNKMVSVKIDVVEDPSQLSELSPDFNGFNKLMFYQSKKNDDTLYKSIERTLEGKDIQQMFFEHSVL